MPWHHQGVPYTVAGHWSGLIYHDQDEWDLPGGWIEYEVDRVEDLEFSQGGTPCQSGAYDSLAVEFRRDLGPLEEFLVR